MYRVDIKLVREWVFIICQLTTETSGWQMMR